MGSFGHAESWRPPKRSRSSPGPVPCVQRSGRLRMRGAAYYTIMRFAGEGYELQQTFVAHCPRKLFSHAFAALAAGSSMLHADDASTQRRISVENTVTGTLRPFNGASGAPGAEFGEPRPNAPAIDISEGYKKARIDLIRTHDAFGPSDIDAHFGVNKNLPVSIPADRDRLDIFPDMSADADDAKSYNFEPTDRLIASIEAAGAETIFRIGRSIGADPQPPADLDKYASIAKHIVLHYNQGWDRGFHYRLRYWEVWNEPDFRVFWTGTPQQYYELYEKVARAVKSADRERAGGRPYDFRAARCDSVPRGIPGFRACQEAALGFLRLALLCARFQ